MNLNKGCIEIAQREGRGNIDTGMNLNKGCIEIPARRRSIHLQRDEP
mgnify:FL=1